MEKTYTLKNRRRIRLLEGDITRVAADAIVNAANSALAGGGGVDGAIHRAGGPEIMQELDRLRPSTGRLAPGKAVATGAGRLPAKFVFHTVGPIYAGRPSDETALRSCYRTCLEMAEERECRTISFPAISTGAYGYPAEDAARVAIMAVRAFLEGQAKIVEELIFVQFGQAAFNTYMSYLDAA